MRFLSRQPASEAVSHVLDLEGMDCVQWLLTGGTLNDTGTRIPGGALEQLRRNVEIDENGLPMLLRALEIVNGASPVAESCCESACIRTGDEITAVRHLMSVLEKGGADAKANGSVFDAIPLQTTDMFETWMPAEAVDRWGFVVATLCTPDRKKAGDRLRRSLMEFGVPHAIQQVDSEAHCDVAQLPTFILAMLDRYNLPVVQMDCDLVLVEEPVHLPKALRDGADVAMVNTIAHMDMARIFSEISSESQEGLRLFELNSTTPPLLRRALPEQLQITGGPSLWNNTQASRKLLLAWSEALLAFSGGDMFRFSSNHVFDWVWNNRGKRDDGLLAAKAFWLPPSYDRLPGMLLTAPIVNRPDYEAFPCTGTLVHMYMPAHKGTQRLYFQVPEQSLARPDVARDALCHDHRVFDIKFKTAGSLAANGSYSAAVPLETPIYPPEMVDWEACRNPYHERRVRIHALFHEALVYAKRALESIRLPFHLACGTALCARQEIFDNDDTQRTRIPCDPDIVLQVVSCL